LVEIVGSNVIQLITIVVLTISIYLSFNSLLKKETDLFDQSPSNILCN